MSKMSDLIVAVEELAGVGTLEALALGGNVLKAVDEGKVKGRRPDEDVRDFVRRAMVRLKMLRPQGSGGRRG